MKRFRFRLARLLALRERVFEQRRVELESAREAARRTERALEDATAARRGAQESLAGGDHRLTPTERHHLLLYADHLALLAAALTEQLAADRRHEAARLAALHDAARDRKVLLRLRARRVDEHRREIDRSEQKSNDEYASRRRAFLPPPGLGDRGTPPGGAGTFFRERRNALPGESFDQDLSKSI